MLKIKNFSLIILFVLLGNVANAEHPAAEKYKKILSSTTYSVEYSTPSVDKILTVIDNKRIDYTFVKGGSQLVPLGGFGKNQPTAFYLNGKYYQVSEENRAYMARESQLRNVNLDPQKGWGTIQARLALPPELAIFAPNDAFNKYTDFRMSSYVDSGKKMMKFRKKDCNFTYDKYVTAYEDAGGGIHYKKIYYVCYDAKGILKAVETCLDVNGQESSVQIMEIKDVSTSVTEEEKNLPKGYVVFAAGMGDMNDLVNRNVIVEDYRKNRK